MRVRVSFACNDHRNGSFSGAFEAAEFEIRQTYFLSVFGPRTKIHWSERTLANYSSAGDASLVIIATRAYPHFGRNKWEGNWCWDACSMHLPQAQSLIRQLLRLGFTVEESTLTGPLAGLRADEKEISR